jgi:hypothetical protein
LCFRDEPFRARLSTSADQSVTVVACKKSAARPFR